MSQPNPPSQTTNSGGNGLRSIALGLLVLVAVLSVGFAGYLGLNQHAVTVTNQQFITNTQSIYSFQTVVSVSTATSITTTTNTVANGYGNGNYGNYLACGYYGCYQGPGYSYYYPGYYNGYYAHYQPCQPTGPNNTVTCSGYLYQPQSGCTVLVVPAINNPYPSYATTNVNEYYSLQNLPSNMPAIGTWVTVSGQLYQGYNASPNGNACPGNFINVSSIS